MSVKQQNILIVLCLSLMGCVTQQRAANHVDKPLDTYGVRNEPRDATDIQLIGYLDDASTEASSAGEPRAFVESLQDLEQQSYQNPSLRRLWCEYQAALAKVRYADELPDPKVGANIFGQPIETAAGSQRANLTLSQMLPWLPRLEALAQQACFEAAILGQSYEGERLRITGDIRSLWYRLYLLQKQIEINSANQELLESLIDVANTRVSTGNASQGDVLAGTLEYSRLEEQLVTLRQQMESTKSQLNRLLGRDVEVPIGGPRELTVSLPAWNQAMLRSVAWSHQPAIETARIRQQATRWGIEVARLKQKPDFTLSASWFAVDDNRPSPNIVDVGQDAWAVGAMMTLPLRHEKYDAIEQEALWRHAAAASSVEEVRQRFDALLIDLWEQALAADDTALLYRETIIPDAKRTLEADQEAYSNGEVEFDRVVRDFRSLLTLENGLHKSRAQLATALARIEQATGGFLDASVAGNERLPSETGLYQQDFIERSTDATVAPIPGDISVR